MKRIFLLCLLFTLVLVSASPAQTVVQRTRLGNAVEGMTFVSNGPYAKHLVLIDGQNLIAVPAEGRGSTPFKTLFDLTPLGFSIAPRGVAWMASDNLFIFTDATVGGASTIFRLSDHQGHPKGTISFAWPSDFVDAAPYVEEIAWVPMNASRFAGDFIFIARPSTGDFFPTLFVMDRGGNYVSRIALNQDSYSLDPIGLAYVAPGKLLLGNSDGYLYEIDLDGNFLAPPVFFPDATDIEGVAALASGRIAITSHSNGKLIYLDSNLNRLPEERSYRVGFGLSTAGAVAWNSATGEYIVYFTDVEPSLGLPQLASISANMQSAHLYFDMAPFANQALGRMDYIPPADAVAMPYRSTPVRHLQFFSPSGSWEGPTIGDGSPANRLTAFTYLPETGGYAARRLATPTVLDFFDAAAQPTGVSIDLSPWMQPDAVIIDVALFASPENPAMGEFLVLASGTPRQLLRADLNGNVTAVYDTTPLNALNLYALKYIDSGPYAGDFAAIDNNTNELIVFQLP